ncbi:hypothetical protein HK104_010888 [Borealophlyctis nickersoniae]|nr:hypothetical protein HK104_010888 [Borealophlyctis nickersoniae]
MAEKRRTSSRLSVTSSSSFVSLRRKRGASEESEYSSSGPQPKLAQLRRSMRLTSNSYLGATRRGSDSRGKGKQAEDSEEEFYHSEEEEDQIRLAEKEAAAYAAREELRRELTDLLKKFRIEWEEEKEEKRQNALRDCLRHFYRKQQLLDEDAVKDEAKEVHTVDEAGAMNEADTVDDLEEASDSEAADKSDPERGSTSQECVVQMVVVPSGMAPKLEAADQPDPAGGSTSQDYVVQTVVLPKDMAPKSYAYLPLSSNFLEFDDAAIRYLPHHVESEQGSFAADVYDPDRSWKQDLRTWTDEDQNERDLCLAFAARVIKEQIGYPAVQEWLIKWEEEEECDFDFEFHTTKVLCALVDIAQRPSQKHASPAHFASAIEGDKLLRLFDAKEIARRFVEENRDLRPSVLWREDLQSGSLCRICMKVECKLHLVEFQGIENYGMYSWPNQTTDVDATRKGNKSRFINDPRNVDEEGSEVPQTDDNIIPQVKYVCGQIRIGMYAKKDIAENEELFFSYGSDFYQ